MVLGPPMVGFVTVLKPVVYGLDALANAVVRLCRVEPRSEVTSTFTLEEVEAMVDESREEGMLDQGEYERLSGALGFTSRTVADVLLPLGDLETVERGARASDVEVVCAQTGYSRFPVMGEGGDLVGYLHIKDVLQQDPHGRARVVEDKWIRPFAGVRAPTRSPRRSRPSRPRGRTSPAWSTSAARSWAWPRSRTSSRCWWARSATPPTPRGTEAGAGAGSRQARPTLRAPRGG